MLKSQSISKKTCIPVSGKVFDHEEINNAIKVAHDDWWTELCLTTCF